MSAFMVTREHIDVLLASALRNLPNHRPNWAIDDPDEVDWQERRYQTLDFTTADYAGVALLAENARSVRFRYPDADEHDMVDDTEIIGYEYRDPGFTPTPVEGLKALSCLEYQSCECTDFQSSEAARILDALRHHLIAALPGMNDGPWDWTADDINARRRVVA